MNNASNSVNAEQNNVHVDFAAAFVRGRLIQGDSIPLPQELTECDLDRLTTDQKCQIYRAGQACGLRLTKFKRTMGLARVNKVLGILSSLTPTSLLDVGSGRGAFLWSLLDEFPSLPVTAIDHDPQRASDLKAVHAGGIFRLTGAEMDLCNLKYSNNEFDVVTVLEVLEHIPNFQQAIAEALRVARRFVVASVPSKSDDNPEHLHLLTRDLLTNAFEQSGCTSLKFDSVLNHLVLVAKTS